MRLPWSGDRFVEFNIATSIALNISVLCILGDTNENSLRCTVLDFHFWKQCPFYSYSSLN